MSPLDTFKSADDILEHHSKLTSSSEDYIKLKKQFIQDSFKVSRFHRIYKKWENEKKSKFIHQEIEPYNSKLGSLTKLNYETENLQSEYSKLQRQINLPNFLFAKETLERYNDGELLKALAEGEKGKSEIGVDKIFSVKIGDKLPNPEFKVFKDLLSIEYRLRLEKRIKYEVLLTIKQQLTTNNKKWAARDSALNEFMRKLENVTEEVENIRKSERDDLRDYDDYLIDEDEIDIEDFEEHEDDEADETDEVSAKNEGEVAEDGNENEIEDAAADAEEDEPDKAVHHNQEEEDSAQSALPALEGSDATGFEEAGHLNTTDAATNDAGEEDEEDELMAIEG